MAWNTLHDLVALHERERDRRLTASTAWTPPVDLVETPTAFVLVAELPGFGRDDFSVDATSESVTLSGRRPELPLHPEQFLRLERGQGPFSRTFAFPHAIDTQGIRAELGDGILTVTIPKAGVAAPRRIDVT